MQTPSTEGPSLGGFEDGNEAHAGAVGVRPGDGPESAEAARHALTPRVDWDENTLSVQSRTALQPDGRTTPRFLPPKRCNSAGAFLRGRTRRAIGRNGQSPAV